MGTQMNFENEVRRYEERISEAMSHLQFLMGAGAKGILTLEEQLEITNGIAGAEREFEKVMEKLSKMLDK